MLTRMRDDMLTKLQSHKSYSSKQPLNRNKCACIPWRNHSTWMCRYNTCLVYYDEIIELACENEISFAKLSLFTSFRNGRRSPSISFDLHAMVAWPDLFNQCRMSCTIVWLSLFLPVILSRHTNIHFPCNIPLKNLSLRLARLPGPGWGPWFSYLSEIFISEFVFLLFRKLNLYFSKWET